MKTLTYLLLFLSFLGCGNLNDSKKDFKIDLGKHRFDYTVIDNLPRYDALRQIILNNYDSFYLNSTENYLTYFYEDKTPVQIRGYSNYDLPEIIYPETVLLFQRIGKKNIFGFTIYRDSTLEILIRNTHLSQYFLDVRERLRWYPNTNKIKTTEFPFKDTLLTDKWQYKIWYDKRSEFF